MFAHTLFAAALVASTAFTSALPAIATVKQAAAAAKALQQSENTISISPDGTCGGTTGYTCSSSAFGDCCSVTGFCGSTQAFCSTSNCVPGSGFCDSDDSSSSATSTDFEGINNILLSEPDTNMAAVVQDNILPLLTPSPTEVAPVAAVHTPWKPTPFHDYVHRPSYVIDNGERAPNQVWN